MTPPPKKPAPCPICGRPAVAAFTPFCSARCSDVDLGRWLSDRYVIPAEDEDGTDPPPERSE
ncbi:DNA gyrase inhibitor YacG [Methylobacterium planeticum]|uniref:DNA gyrase inhibitor YacG n=1 Tax=Methylobacterium planeticum TaxID=2615211 RepID=UPI001FEDC91B|nr:DNA gyrase inhibitor YacG [Methylobacterium planeticum]